MPSHIFSAHILNNPLAASADVDTTSKPGSVLITGLLEIDALTVVPKEVVAVAETKQEAEVGFDVAPTVIAARKYQIRIGNEANTRESFQSQLIPVGYTAPTVLTGTAETDRLNLWSSMITQINALDSIDATASLIVTLTGTETAAFVVGEIATQDVSLATGIVISAGTTTKLRVTSGTFNTSGDINGSISGDLNTISATDLAAGLHILDDGNYYPAEVSIRDHRAENTVIQTEGFALNSVVITIAAVIERGQGAKLIKMVPVQELTSANLAAGNIDFPTSEAPISGVTYSLFVLEDRWNLNQDALTGGGGSKSRVHHLYVDDNATNFAALRTTLLAL